jgi:hypothetical protein
VAVDPEMPILDIPLLQQESVECVTASGDPATKMEGQFLF